jgi:Uma2 family endonuclease
VFPGDTGFFFNRDPQVVLFPDVAFVRIERLPPPVERVGFLDVIPDLVVEIISPSERPAAIKDKIDFHLERGVQLVWVVYPSRGVVVVHRPGQGARTLAAGDELTAEELLPGFRLPVADVFR